MAERESAHGSGSQTKDRKRKQNFSVYEIEVITDNVKKNLDLIQSVLATTKFAFNAVAKDWLALTCCSKR